MKTAMTLTTGGRAGQCEEDVAAFSKEEAAVSWKDEAARAGLLATVLDVLREVTGEERIPPSKPLLDAGIDSTSVVQFVEALQQRTGLKVAPMVVFMHTTAVAVGAHLAQLAGLGMTVPRAHIVHVDRAAPEVAQQCRTLVCWTRTLVRLNLRLNLHMSALAAAAWAGDVPTARAIALSGVSSLSPVCHLSLRGGGRGNGHYPPKRQLLHVTGRDSYVQIQANTNAMWTLAGEQELHWHSAAHAAWLSKAADGSDFWCGWSATDAKKAEVSGGKWQPWDALCDTKGAPFVRWYIGGELNAAFNELDRHVLAEHGDNTAIIGETDVGHLPTRVKELLVHSTLAAHALRSTLRIECGERMAIYLPNDAHAVVWIEAAKRLGAPYTAIAAGTASALLTDRLTDTGAAVLVTCGSQAEAVLKAVHALDALSFSVAVVAVGDKPDVRLPSDWHAAGALLAAAVACVVWPAHLLSWLRGEELARTLWTLAPPEPVDASHPLFILYTSGSTGKPKGIVHAHGGYLTGLIATSVVVLNLQAGGDDVLFVVATPGWITGQSYMISAALLCRVPSVLLEGSPVSPPDRFAAVIARHRVSVLKAGSTFLRMLMTRPNAEALLAEHSVASLRLGTFCAEPVNEAVHRFAATHLTCVPPYSLLPLPP